MTLSPASSLINRQCQRAYFTSQEALKKINGYAETALSIQETTARMQGITKLHTEGIRQITSEDYQGGLKKSMEAYAQRIELFLIRNITARTITLLEGDSSLPISKCLQRIFCTSNDPEGAFDINKLRIEQEKLSKLEQNTVGLVKELNTQLETVRTTANIEKECLNCEQPSKIVDTFTRQYDQLLSDLIATIEKVNSVFQESLIQAEAFFGKICAENRKNSPLISANAEKHKSYLRLIEEKQLLASYAEKITAYCSMDFNKLISNKSMESFPVLKQQIFDLNEIINNHLTTLKDRVTTLTEKGKELESILDRYKEDIENYLKKPPETLSDWVDVKEGDGNASHCFTEKP